MKVVRCTFRIDQLQKTYFLVSEYSHSDNDNKNCENMFQDIITKVEAGKPLLCMYNAGNEKQVTLQPTILNTKVILEITIVSIQIYETKDKDAVADV